MDWSAENLKLLFDGYGIIIAFAWSLCVKYVPWKPLAMIPNNAIPYLNFLIYALAKLAAPPAQAALFGGIVSTVPDLVGILIGGFTSAVWARQLYEGFGRTLLERVLRLPKNETVLASVRAPK